MGDDGKKVEEIVTIGCTAFGTQDLAKRMEL